MNYLRATGINNGINALKISVFADIKLGVFASEKEK